MARTRQQARMRAVHPLPPERKQPRSAVVGSRLNLGCLLFAELPPPKERRPDYLTECRFRRRAQEMQKCSSQVAATSSVWTGAGCTDPRQRFAMLGHG